MQADHAAAAFERAYGRRPDRVFFAPGRVNIIGEHLDYNGGHVMPAALTLGAGLAVGAGQPGVFRMRSENMPELGTVACPVNGTADFDGPGWARYPVGIIHGAMAMGAEMPPADMLFCSDLPLGAGLSSSAAITVATALSVMALSGLELDKLALARLAMRTEKDYVGLSCGIMDPYSSLFGRAGEAMLIDCETDTHSYIPLTLGAYALAIAYTGKPRQLVGSLFDIRAEECRMALEIVRRERPDLGTLCKLHPDELPGLEHLFDEAPLLFARMRHVVSENRRVADATEAFMIGDIEWLSGLFADSHRSLREDYEVSCHELDSFVEALLACRGVAAARMTGAGFGGCLVALVRRDGMEDALEDAAALYYEKTGLKAQFYSGEVGDGAREFVL